MTEADREAFLADYLELLRRHRILVVVNTCDEPTLSEFEPDAEEDHYWSSPEAAVAYLRTTRE